MFQQVSIQPEGYSVTWGDNLEILYPDLYSLGVEIPLELDDFRNFVRLRVVDTPEAARILNCSVQNINDKKVRNTLVPIKTSSKYSLFLKGDIEHS